MPMIRKFYLFVALILSSSSIIFAQCDIVLLDSQAAVNSFRTTHGCTVSNTLRITGNDIVNLDSLYSITTISDRLTIGPTTNLVSLHGLENITTIRTLEVYDNIKLANLAGLSGLQVVQGAVSI